MYKIIYSKPALKHLRKIPKDYQLKIIKAIERLSSNPLSGDIQWLESRFDASHRLRVGSYKIFFTYDTISKIIIIADIRRRTSQTYS